MRKYRTILSILTLKAEIFPYSEPILISAALIFLSRYTDSCYCNSQGKPGKTESSTVPFLSSIIPIIVSG